jgi:hypothetical protein
MWKLTISAAVVILGMISCGQSMRVSNSHELNVQSETKEPVSNSPTNWQDLEGSIDATAMLRFRDGLLLVGQSGIAEVTSGDTVRKYPPFVIRKEFTTVDGGITLERVKSKDRSVGDERSFPYVCDPETVVSENDQLLVLADCEHSKQLWRVLAENDKTSLDIINFVTEDKHKALLPSVIVASGKISLIGINTESESLLLAPEKNKDNLKVIWKGNKGGAGIAAVSFADDNGWMLLGDGKILQSVDGGFSWNQTSVLSKIQPKDFINVKFATSDEGYIVGAKGALLKTTDGGKTWKSISTPVTNDLRNLALGSESIILCCVEDKLMATDKGFSAWTSVEVPDGMLSDIILINKTLYVLINGKLQSKHLN